MSSSCASTNTSRGNKKASNYESRSKRAGLQFPIGRVARFLRARKYAERVSAGAPVYLAAVLEYLAAEVLELAGNMARDSMKTRISPRHIQAAITADAELGKLLNGVVIPNVGDMTHLNHLLQQKISRERV